MAKPLCSGCVPEGHHMPSGYAWFHEKSCSLFPGQKIESDSAPVRRLSLVGGRDWGRSTEDVPTRLDPTEAHPACIAAAADGATPCSRCSWLLDRDNEGARYIDHHLEDSR